MNCTPNGSLSLLNPHGTLIAGNPHKLEIPSGARLSIGPAESSSGGAFKGAAAED